MPISQRTLHACLLIAVVGLIWSSTASAHQTALSTMEVEVQPEQRRVEMVLTMEPTDLTDHLGIDPNGDGFLDQEELAEVKPELADYVLQRMSAANAGAPCEVVDSGVVDTPRREPTVSFQKVVECAEPLGELGLTNRVLLDEPEGYTHYAQIEIGKDIHTTVFNKASPTYAFEIEQVVDGAGGDAAQSEPQSFLQVAKTFVWQGVLHIVLGLDHVLFVLCLLLVARELKRLVAVVTTFTLAHSVTLALSTLEVVAVPASVVEPLIALSIAWAATESILGREPGDYLYGLTFAFGLLHGFGFSYVLRDVGLPDDAIASALFSFNVGVELGQIGIVALAFPLVKRAEEQDWGATAFRVVGGSVLAIAVFWTVERVIAAL